MMLEENVMKHYDEDTLKAIIDRDFRDGERRGLFTSILREDGEILFRLTELGKQRAEQGLLFLVRRR
jgi:hypothetical protein